MFPTPKTPYGLNMLLFNSDLHGYKWTSYTFLHHGSRGISMMKPISLILGTFWDPEKGFLSTNIWHESTASLKNTTVAFVNLNKTPSLTFPPNVNMASLVDFETHSQRFNNFTPSFTIFQGHLCWARILQQKWSEHIIIVYSFQGK